MRFTRATVPLENGRDLVVRAPANSAKNLCVQGLEVNGGKWGATSLPHVLLARGGVLDFAMGPRPSSWGTGKDAAPASVTTDDQVPSPPRDVPKGCPVIPGGRATTATAPRRVAGTPEYIQYSGVPPPCDAPRLTPHADPPGIAGQPLGARVRSSTTPRPRRPGSARWSCRSARRPVPCGTP
ncbi:glycoside hydrolase domain-containing protein [Streptomyces sp. NPDC058195]|uniref:glycoside hydrolase domain-containing protein n=1 Tax=Streptomyces sp. NPDC058195 TaxID=3346375 RepID=UPI0036E1DC45